MLPAINWPIFVVCGRRDARGPLSGHEVMRSGSPGSRIEVIEELGHMSPVEEPKAVLTALERWLPA